MHLTIGINKLSMTRYTCEECVQGLEWVEMYMEDPIMVAEFTIYLEQNYCIGDQLGIEMVQSVFVFRSRIAKTGFSLILKLVLLQMNGNTARKASLNTSPQCTTWPWRSFSSQPKFGWWPLFLSAISFFLCYCFILSFFIISFSATSKRSVELPALLLFKKKSWNVE